MVPFETEPPTAMLQHIRALEVYENVQGSITEQPLTGTQTLQNVMLCMRQYDELFTNNNSTFSIYNECRPSTVKITHNGYNYVDFSIDSLMIQFHSCLLYG